jgi:2-polyprenyl-6-methoxyphenol hydroxylase-like FAD-dependent oxidoreductase
MFGKKLPEVLIVGAGPVGLFSALALTEQGIRVHVIDKEWRRAGHSYALALHSNTLKLFEKLGLLETILEHSYKVRSIGLYDGTQRKAEMHISSLEEDFSFLVVTQQDILEGILEEALKAYNVKVMWSHRLAHLTSMDDHAHVVIDKLMKESLGYIIARTEWVVAKSQRIDVPFVIGADGHHSFVRRSLGIGFETVGETQNFAVFEFKTDADLQHEMRLVLDDGTMNVLWQLPGGYCRWSFQLLDFEAFEESRDKDRYEVQIGTGRYPMLTEEYLHELLAKRAPWFKGSVDEIRWRLVVRFERRLASSYGSQRVWLAGDAVHLTGPAGIQSMNVGLLEANDLAGTIVRILRDGESTELLQVYNNDWQAEWRYLLGLKGGLKAGKQTDPWVRAHSAQLLSSIPATSDNLVSLAGQIGLKA